MFTWLRRWWIDWPSDTAARAADRSVAIAGDNTNSPITIGLDEAGVRRVMRDELSRLAEAKGVPEAPLRAVLKRLGEKRVPVEEIPARLAAAADELIRLREDLARLRNDRPEFAAIRARASALIDRGDFEAARTALREGRTAARALRQEYSRSEAGFLADEARVDRLQLNYGAACEKFAEAARLDPEDCWIWIELGDLWTLRGSLAEAEKSLRAGLMAAVRSGDERDLSVSHNKIGDVQVEQGDLAAALASYRASHGIFERLAEADPANAGWQRDLSVSHNKIGDMQVEQGDLAAALASYRASLAIAERLAEADPANAGWQRDLSVSHERIGDMQVEQGDLAAALASYRASLAIRARLAEADPANAGWQRDLALSYGRMGMIEAQQGALEPARGALQQGWGLLAKLARQSPDNAKLLRDLAWFDSQIAQLDD